MTFGLIQIAGGVSDTCANFNLPARTFPVLTGRHVSALFWTHTCKIEDLQSHLPELFRPSPLSTSPQLRIPFQYSHPRAIHIIPTPQTILPPCPPNHPYPRFRVDRPARQLMHNPLLSFTNAVRVRR